MKQRHQQSQAAVAQVKVSGITKTEKNEFIIEMGKFFLDLSKLIFGGMFLTAIMDVSFDMEKVITICSIIISALALFGLGLIYIGTKKQK